MATTTNYSWTTPDDTDLVKDGAAAIRTLGSSIDTTVFNNAAASIAKTIVDAKGDLIAASAADTPARLAIGTNGQVLTADSTETTGMKWATSASGGGMTLLSTTTLSGASTTISGISGAYKNLVMQIHGVENATADVFFTCKPNNVATYYFSSGLYKDQTNGGSGGEALYIAPNTIVRTNTNNAFTVEINNYASATNYKTTLAYSTFQNTSLARVTTIFGGGLSTNDAITSLVFANSGGNFSGGTVLLYGVN